MNPKRVTGARVFILLVAVTLVDAQRVPWPQRQHKSPEPSVHVLRRRIRQPMRITIGSSLPEFTKKLTIVRHQSIHWYKQYVEVRDSNPIKLVFKTKGSAPTVASHVLHGDEAGEFRYTV